MQIPRVAGRDYLPSTERASDDNKTKMTLKTAADFSDLRMTMFIQICLSLLTLLEGNKSEKNSNYSKPYDHMGDCAANLKVQIKMALA